jgi:dynein light intermediate chain 1
MPERIDTLARLSVYTVQSSNPAHLGLVPQILPAKTSLHNTLVMVLLDWTRPWTFVEQLENWLIWVDKWAKGDGSRDMEVARDEGRERCEYVSPSGVYSYQCSAPVVQFHLQHYSEPTAEPLPITTATLADANVLPLPQGTLTNNSAGVAIVVVCTKADLIDDNSDIAGVGASGMGGMVKGKGGEWEEQTDGVMQVLRTICLKCRLFLKFLRAVSQSILCRWRGSVLYFTSPCNGRSSTSIRPPLPLHPESTSTCDWFVGHPNSRAKPIPFQRTSKCTG